MKAPAQNAVDRLDEVRVPTLILIGENDRLQREQADLLGPRVKGARLVVVPGESYSPNLLASCWFWGYCFEGSRSALAPTARPCSIFSFSVAMNRLATSGV